MKKKPLPIKEAAKQTKSNSSTIIISKPLKIEAVLMAFIDRGYEGMNKLEANQDYGDTCLNSSVSTLSHCYVINFKRESEKINNRVGGISIFTRYWFLTNDDEEKAKALINSLRVKRGLSPIEWRCAHD